MCILCKCQDWGSARPIKSVRCITDTKWYLGCGLFVWWQTSDRLPCTDCRLSQHFLLCVFILFLSSARFVICWGCCFVKFLHATLLHNLVKLWNFGTDCKTIICIPNVIFEMIPKLSPCGQVYTLQHPCPYLVVPPAKLWLTPLEVINRNDEGR